MEETKERKGLFFAIVGVCTLIVAIVGSTFAYYVASVNNTTAVTGTAGGSNLSLTVQKKSTGATGNLIPLADGTKSGYTSKLSAAASASTQCVDTAGKTVCQVYEIKVKNNSTVTDTVNVGITALSGTNTPNIKAVLMTGQTTISSTAAPFATLTVSNIASSESITAGSTKTYYIMVYIQEQGTTQTDSGSFSGTITATSTQYASNQVTGQFS